MFDIPNRWLTDQAYRNGERKDVLKDMLAWAMGADIIEGFAEINDELLSQMHIPVRLTEYGKGLAFRAAREEVSAWAAVLTEYGVDVKLFARSDNPDRFRIMEFEFLRPEKSYSEVRTKAGRWEEGVIQNWKSQLPDTVLDAIRH